MLGIKKTSLIKNKFFDAKPCDEKTQEDLDMECEEIKEVDDIEMRFVDEEIVTIHEMEIDEQTLNESPEPMQLDEE